VRNPHHSAGTSAKSASSKSNPAREGTVLADPQLEPLGEERRDRDRKRGHKAERDRPWTERAAALRLMGHPIGIVEAVALESLGQVITNAGFFVPAALGVQEGAQHENPRRDDLATHLRRGKKQVRRFPHPARPEEKPGRAALAPA